MSQGQPLWLCRKYREKTVIPSKPWSVEMTWGVDSKLTGIELIEPRESPKAIYQGLYSTALL